MGTVDLEGLKKSLEEAKATWKGKADLIAQGEKQIEAIRNEIGQLVNQGNALHGRILTLQEIIDGLEPKPAAQGEPSNELPFPAAQSATLAAAPVEVPHE
jgi:chromosome segregation ATPase